METIKAYTDIVAKYILGREETKDILIGFINAVFEDSNYQKITSVEILNPFSIQEFEGDKLSVLDIKAIDENGRIINIEIQAYSEKIFPIRSLYYWAEIYSEQLEKSDIYSKLKPVVCINLVNFVLEQRNDLYHNCYLITNSKNPELILTDHLVLHFVEMPKLLDFPGKTKLENWINFFKNEGSGEDVMKTVINDDENLERAHEQYKKFTADQKMRFKILDREKAERDRISRLHDAAEEGMEKGLKEGLEKGLKQGIEQGIEQGRKDERVETAIKMLKCSMSMEDISEITGLSIREIEKMK